MNLRPKIDRHHFLSFIQKTLLKEHVLQVRFSKHDEILEGADLSTIAKAHLTPVASAICAVTAGASFTLADGESINTWWCSNG